MSMFEMIKLQLGQVVPFANHTGVVIEDLCSGGATASLEQAKETSNHIGTQHAGALFTLGEAASGAAMSGTFAEVILKVRPVAAEAKIDFKKMAKGRIVAIAETKEDADRLLQTLKSDGRVRFSIAVALTNSEQEEVASMVVDWDVRLPKKH